MSNNKYIVSTFILACSLGATNLGDFVGYWEGTESLSSPTMSYEGRAAYISFRHNDNLEENLLYTSNLDFIYNGYLDWAPHHFTYNKSENQVTFERRFTTPLGILGSQELVYNIIENDEKVHMVMTDECSLSVDTEADLHNVERKMENDKLMKTYIE